MYCVKCGVELSDGQAKCPLCGTRVYHPDIPATFPLHSEEEMTGQKEINKNGVLFIITVVFILGVLLTLICDIGINRHITWSGYTVSSILFLYVVVILPVWFKKPNPVIFVAADFAGAALLLLYINILTNGSWFFPFALPVTCTAAFITLSVISLVRYIKRGYLYIFGGALIAIGASMFLIEMLINSAFGLRNSFVWFFYPLTVLAVTGLVLIVIAICPSLRESLEKKFFI